MESGGSASSSPVAASLAAADLVEALPDCVLVIDAFGLIRYVNRTAEEQLGYRADEWIGQTVLKVIDEDDVAVVLSSMETVQAKRVGTPVEVRVRGADGMVHLYEVIGRPVVLDDGVPGIVCAVRNISQRRMWEVAAGDVQRFQHLVQVAPAITLLLDADGVVTSVNAAFTRACSGMTRASSSGARSWASSRTRTPSASPPSWPGWRQGCGPPRSRRRCESSVRVRRTRPVRFELVSQLNDRVLDGIVVSGYDVSELTTMREELEYLAGHDPLTGLASRSQLVKDLERELDRGHRFALLFIDLDRFKPVNDLWGHEVGDEILRQVGRRLGLAARADDQVARVGGDEFVVVATDVTDVTVARSLADRMEASLSQPYVLDVGVVRIGASVGVALPDADATVAGILADADMAMYDIKLARRGTSRRSTIERRRSAVERRRLVDEFVVGLGHGEVVAHLQPIVEVGTRRLVSLEALARWNHPQLGLLAPVAFLDLVEAAGLGLQLGDAVLDSACATVAELASLGRGTNLSVNLSVAQLTDVGITERIGAIVHRHGLSLQQLEVEITEQAILAPLATAAGVSCDQTLHALHDAGATLMLDDFGTGYSSLTHVRRFPLGAVKIDRSFVDGMLERQQDRAVVEVIIGLARALNLRSVAEGVETWAQLEALDALGCDLAQGHCIAEPMAADDTLDWVLHH